MARTDFFDSNVLLYLFSQDYKAERAERLIAAGGVISVQTLNEITHVARRKFRADWPIVKQSLTTFESIFTVEPLTLETHRLALEISERHGFTIFDSLLLASATLARCVTFWSEDLQSGFRLGDLTVRNPFA